MRLQLEGQGRALEVATRHAGNGGVARTAVKPAPPLVKGAIHSDSVTVSLAIIIIMREQVYCLPALTESLLHIKDR